MLVCSPGDPRVYRLLLLLSACSPPDDSGPLPDVDTGVPDDRPHVVVVIIDGARYSETLGDPTHAWTPHLAALAAEGCAPGPIRNEGIPITTYGMASIHTGAWDAFASDAYGRGWFTSPTWFEYLRKKTGAPAEDAWYVLPAWDDDLVWTGSRDPDYGLDYWPSLYTEGTYDLDVAEAAVEVLRQATPALTVVYLPRVDAMAHTGSWSEYTTALGKADEAVGLIWEAVEARAPLAGRTTLLVTSDHGRHDDAHGGFQNHGCSCDGCRDVTFLAIGPGVDPACTPSRPWETVDLVPTVGRLLGFTAEKAEGRVMEEIW